MVAEKVVVQLVLDTSKYTANAQGAARSTAKIQSATDKTAGSMSKLSQTAGKLGLVLGAAFVVKGALNFAKSSIAAFSSLNESVNAVEVSFGEASAGVLKLGQNSAKQFGLSTRAVNQAAVAMSAFADKIDEADPADAFGNVLQRATDFASVMDIEVEEALVLFRSGLAGESEPLRKFGIDLSAATVNLVGLEAGLGGVNGKLDEGEKVQARYLAIMEQTEKVAGDFANTSDSLANRQKTLTAEWEEAQAVIGEELAPVMIKLLGIVTDQIIPALIGLIPLVKLAADAFSGFLGVLEPGIAITSRFASDLGALVGSLQDGNLNAVQYNKAMNLIITTQRKGGDGAVAFANAISNLADNHILDAEALEILAAATEFEGDQRAVAIQLALEDARVRGVAASQVAVLEDALLSEINAMDLNKEVRIALIDSLGLTDRALTTTTGLLGLGTDATGRYNDFLASQITLASAAAVAEQERAAGIRAGLQAQAEAANPLIRLLNTQSRLVSAQENLNEVREDGKATTQDTIDAITDLVAAEANFESAAANVSGLVDEGATAFERFGIVAGATREELDLVLDTINKFPTTIDVNLNLNTGGFTIGEVQNILRGSGGISKRHGGPVAADEPFIVGEAGPELFIPDQAGRIIPNKGVGDGQSIVVNVNDSTTTDLAADLSAGLIAAQITQQVELLRV